MKKTMSLEKIRGAKLGLGLVALAMLAMLVAAAWATGWREMGAALAALPWWGWLLVVVTPIVNNVPRWWRYPMGAAALGITTIPLGRWALYYTAGTALMATPGKLGLLLRLWLLERHHAVPLRRTYGLFVFDAGTDSLTLLGVTVLVIMAGMTPLPAAQLWLWGVLGVGVVGGLLAWPWVVKNLRWRWLADLRPVLNRELWLAGVLLSTVAFLAMGICCVGLLAALGHTLPLGQMLLVLGASIMVGMAVMLPGGLGGTEVSMVGLLHWLGVPLPVAVTFTALYRLANLWLPTLVGWAFLPWALRKQR